MTPINPADTGSTIDDAELYRLSVESSLLQEELQREPWSESWVLTRQTPPAAPMQRESQIITYVRSSLFSSRWEEPPSLSIARKAQVCLISIPLALGVTSSFFSSIPELGWDRQTTLTLDAVSSLLLLTSAIFLIGSVAAKFFSQRSAAGALIPSERSYQPHLTCCNTIMCPLSFLIGATPVAVYSSIFQDNEMAAIATLASAGILGLLVAATHLGTPNIRTLSSLKEEERPPGPDETPLRLTSVERVNVLRSTLCTYIERLTVELKESPEFRREFIRDLDQLQMATPSIEERPAPLIYSLLSRHQIPKDPCETRGGAFLLVALILPIIAAATINGANITYEGLITRTNGATAIWSATFAAFATYLMSALATALGIRNVARGGLNLFRGQGSRNFSIIHREYPAIATIAKVTVAASAATTCIVPFAMSQPFAANEIIAVTRWVALPVLPLATMQAMFCCIDYLLQLLPRDQSRQAARSLKVIENLEELREVVREVPVDEIVAFILQCPSEDLERLCPGRGAQIKHNARRVLAGYYTARD